MPLEPQKDTEVPKKDGPSQPEQRKGARTMAYTTLLSQLLGSSHPESEEIIETAGGVEKISEMIQGKDSKEVDKNIKLLRDLVKRMRLKKK